MNIKIKKKRWKKSSRFEISINKPLAIFILKMDNFLKVFWWNHQLWTLHKRLRILEDGEPIFRPFFFLIRNKERLWKHVLVMIYGSMSLNNFAYMIHLSLNRMKTIFGFLSSNLVVIPPPKNFYPIERVEHRIFFIPSVWLYIHLIFNPW